MRLFSLISWDLWCCSPDSWEEGSKAEIQCRQWTGDYSGTHICRGGGAEQREKPSWGAAAAKLEPIPQELWNWGGPAELYWVGAGGWGFIHESPDAGYPGKEHTLEWGNWRQLQEKAWSWGRPTGLVGIWVEQHSGCFMAVSILAFEHLDQ